MSDLSTKIKPGTQGSEPSIERESGGGDLIGFSDPQLHSWLDNVNEKLRDISNTFIHVNRLLKIRVQAWNAATWTNSGVHKLNLSGVPIRSLYVENGTNLGPIYLYSGGNGSGSFPLININSGTWRLSNIDFASEISFIPGPVNQATQNATPTAGQGWFRVVLFEEVMQPNMGQLV